MELYILTWESDKRMYHLAGTSKAVLDLALLLEKNKIRFTISQEDIGRLDQKFFGMAGFEYWVIKFYT